ncbi:MAG TPA: hypothetical protein VFW31_14655 [Candidatus Angelobacter sp.]|nr:hypothetical protein [Candidatus Angelobacter sp.]
MQLQRGIQLGLLHKQLGIDANARVAFQLTPPVVIIWDYNTGTRYTVDGTVPSVTDQEFEVPKRMKDIFAASNEQLKERWDNGWLDGWTDERETIFSELVLRGVNMLPGYRNHSSQQ